MKTISDIRHANLLKLRDEAGSVKRLADRIDRSSSQVSQWLNMSPSVSGKPRVIGDETARLLEEKFGKPRGWMDTIHNDQPVAVARAPAPAAGPVESGSAEDFAQFVAELVALAAKADQDGRIAIMNMARAAAQMAELRSGAASGENQP